MLSQDIIFFLPFKSFVCTLWLLNLQDSCVCKCVSLHLHVFLALFIWLLFLFVFFIFLLFFTYFITIPRCLF
ncbi:rCG59314 [Rattus norvegicus]|uniref:RCG59314 n=1 Tax=Rattus norvegicus TaxID=10116 RepID=A6K7Q8_RAT|nr:rCG59314 [Rattus norvegicus]